MDSVGARKIGRGVLISVLKKHFWATSNRHFRGAFLTEDTQHRTSHKYKISILLEVVFGVQVRICGDGRKLKGPCLLIMNHRTRFDWMFLWCYLVRMGDLQNIKIVLKESLRNVPLLGECGVLCALFAVETVYLSIQSSLFAM